MLTFYSYLSSNHVHEELLFISQLLFYSVTLWSMPQHPLQWCSSTAVFSKQIIIIIYPAESFPNPQDFHTQICVQMGSFYFILKALYSTSSFIFFFNYDTSFNLFQIRFSSSFQIRGFLFQGIYIILYMISNIWSQIIQYLSNF